MSNDQFLRFTNLEWLSAQLGHIVVRASLDQDDTKKINHISSLRYLTVERKDQTTQKLVVKTSAPNQLAQQLGLAREAFFYSSWNDLVIANGASKQLDTVLPPVYFAEGSLETGAKQILMQDLSQCIQSGYFFGPGNPNNWSLPEVTSMTAGSFRSRRISVELISTHAASAAAKLHAPYWNSQALTQVPWLRGCGWPAGQGQAAWVASQAHARQCWEKIKKGVDQKDSKFACWFKESELMQCVDASIAKAAPEAQGWTTFQNELKARPFTLVHGDYHPANFLVRTGTTDNTDSAGPAAASQFSLLLIDWEMVGVGSGPQDMGQYMISHTEPSERKRIERTVVEAYYAELKVLNPDIAMTFDQCWMEYVHGGVGRWMWFLPVLTMMCPEKMMLYFIGQVRAFITAHALTPETIPMPRA